MVPKGTGGKQLKWYRCVGNLDVKLRKGLFGELKAQMKDHL